jgi:hypothetical protein
MISLERGRSERGMVIAGSTGAVLALIKINVGLFYLAGLAPILLWRCPGVASSWWAKASLGTVAVAAGIVLMSGLRQEAWIGRFMLVYSITAVTSLSVAATVCRQMSDGPGQLRLAGLAAVSASAIILGTAITEGIECRVPCGRASFRVPYVSRLPFGSRFAGQV